jgi:hypothetical protein
VVGDGPIIGGHYSLYAGPVDVPLRMCENMGREEVGSGMVERLHIVARPYEIKTLNEEV